MVGALLACFAPQNVFDPAHQCERHEGFLNEVPTVIENQQCAVWVSRHQYDTHFRSLLLQRFCKVGSRHTRHHHIAKQQVYSSRELCFDPNRLFRAARREYGETGVLEYFRDELEKERMIFHNENGLWGCLAVRLAVRLAVQAHELTLHR